MAEPDPQPGPSALGAQTLLERTVLQATSEMEPPPSPVTKNKKKKKKEKQTDQDSEATKAQYPAGFLEFCKLQRKSIAITKQPMMSSNPKISEPEPELQWMPMSRMKNCPPGLEYLDRLNEIMVHRLTDSVEMTSYLTMPKRYTVKNYDGELAYFAFEDVEWKSLNTSNHNFLHPIKIKVIDQTGREVMHISKRKECNCCTYPFITQKLTVHAPPGNIIGYVNQGAGCIECLIPMARLTVQDSNRETVFLIRASLFCKEICGFKVADEHFQILSDGAEIGKIVKKWAGYLQEDSTNYKMSFPMNLDVVSKSLLLAACFLIDFAYFEGNPNRVTATCL